METTPPPPPPINPTPPPVAQPPRPGWWARNWKWFVPAGCLTMLMLFAVFICGIVVLVFSALKSSDVYKTAVARAKADVRVQQALGSQIHEGLFPTGKTNATGASGDADLAISISGDKEKATIYVIATKSEGEWHYSKLSVKTEDGQIIDLNAESE